MAYGKGNLGQIPLTGNATVSDVVSGKEFYSDDPLTKLTGTGANAKRTASGSATLQEDTSASTSTGYIEVTGLGFTPSYVIARFYLDSDNPGYYTKASNANYVFDGNPYGDMIVTNSSSFSINTSLYSGGFKLPLINWYDKNDISNITWVAFE